MLNWVPENSRLEIKFVGRHCHYDGVLHWLKSHRVGFYRSYPSRQVNNVYFDTHDYLAFVENLSGVSRRSKVRYRWYGESVPPSPGIFEVKKKRNCYGWKYQSPVELAPYFEGASWNQIRGKIKESLPMPMKHVLAVNDLPVLVNRYFREYFESRDGKIRITIDTRQQVWDQRFKSIPNFVKETKVPQSVVVEFKLDRRDRSYGSEIIQGVPLRVSRHSKYMNGLAGICAL